MRPIDDYSEFWVNATVEMVDKIDVSGVEDVASIAKAGIEAVDP